MSFELLLQDLRQKSGQRVAAIWRQAKEEAAVLQARHEMELAADMELQERRLEEAAREEAEPIIQAAEIQALRILDNAYREVARRLSSLATEQLGGVRQVGYEGVFAELVAELPEGEWEEVRVSPLDLELAREHFPGAEITADKAITGGFTAQVGQGRHRVVSTLARRLERGWPFVLPRLLQEVEEVLDAASAV
jgi:V/A-type H+/Na+-transporting ATPase subunit E